MAEITGAIFDLDGTLIDSMGMWRGVMEVLTVNQGINFTQELMDRYESCTIPEACDILHNEFGAKATPQELSDELDSLVAEAYRNTVQALPGANEFVLSLKAAGIPCIIASSTPSHLSKVALAANGWSDVFIDALSAGEVRNHRDKEFPDVYLEALSRLGTDQESTWVFEDAPFAVRTSRKAGFHVVGIHNDHDGRDPEFIKAWTDLYSENYESISLDAIAAFDDSARKPMPEV